MKHLIPNISNKGQFPLIQKKLQDAHSSNKHMTWTNDPKPNPKRNPTGRLD